MIRGLTDIASVAELSSLRDLFLQDLKNVPAIPSLQRLTALSRCDIDNLKGVQDLSPVAAAPNLQELVVVSMLHLAPESFKCFSNHPALAAATIGMGSKKKNDFVAALLGKPRVSDIKPIGKYVASWVDG
jgi:hypothetical protein